MSYRTMFREAVGEIPPTSIDMDRVIARERRARRLRRVGVAALAAAAVGVVLVGSTAVTGRPRAAVPAVPSPTSPAVRTPTPSSGGSFTAMDMAIFEAVGRVAPDLDWAPGRGAPEGEGPVWFSGPTLGGYAPDGYMGQGRVRSGDRMGRLSVQITNGWGPAAACTAEAVRRSNCADTTGPAGERIRTLSARNPARGLDRKPSGGVAVSSSATVQRSDGVVIIVRIQGEDENPPLTIAQLIALALDPAVAGQAAQPLRGNTEARRMWITSVVLASLQRHVPGVTGAQGRGAAIIPGDLGAFWGSQDTADSYAGQGRVLVDGVSGTVSVRIHRRDPGTAGDLTCDASTRTHTCEAGTGPAGERYRITTDGSGVKAERIVHVLRRDGVWLAVSLTAGEKGELPLTAAQQRAVALDPAVNLTDRFG
ncbi:hypothetical protein [Micromonospora sp. CB01531]|uniref:hypothetical protein n=1 Tax=Micromonospora sp. CB01531 TaxID=1718947 RepID=UPI00093A3021|nr:hypothetical protein [Micromonospora sp. CB01531]OKI67840.1 hypothetical protein A6A27_21995 [Micromonospora sp. CB01531]